MEYVLHLSPTMMTEAENVIFCHSDSSHPILSGKQSVEKFEEEGGQFTAKTPGSDIEPGLRPVAGELKSLSSNRDETGGSTLICRVHKDLIFYQDGVPLLGGHDGDVHGRGIIVGQRSKKPLS